MTIHLSSLPSVITANSQYAFRHGLSIDAGNFVPIK